MTGPITSSLPVNAVLPVTVVFPLIETLPYKFVEFKTVSLVFTVAREVNKLAEEIVVLHLIAPAVKILVFPVFTVTVLYK